MADDSASPVTPPPCPGVVVARGAEPGRALRIDEVLTDFTLGSDELCHLVIQGANVAPIHASLFRDDDGHVILSDMRSGTGVFVNGDRITEQSLSDGDEISIGPPGEKESAALRFTARIVEAPPQDVIASVPLRLSETSQSAEPAFEPPMTLGTETSPKSSALPKVVLAAAMIAGVGWFGYSKFATPAVPPVLESLSPETAEPGQTVTVNGTGFPERADRTLTLTVGSVTAKIIEATPTRVSFSIPDSLADAGSRTVSVQAAIRGAGSNEKPLKLVVNPKIASLTPPVALAGEEVVIAGQALQVDSTTRPKVTVAGVEAEVLESAAKSVRIRVPKVAATEGQRIPIKVQAGERASNEAPLNYGRLPFVESSAPLRAAPGEAVTITGLGFSTAATVTVGGKPAVVLSATETEIKISTPGLRLQENPGARPMVVTVAGKSSVARPLEIARENAALYAPRFSLEILKDGRPGIVCELGPVMVLNAEASSIARAQSAVARLNELAGRGAKSRIEFSASDGIISGGGDAVLTVAAGDAASTGDDNFRALANLWAAHLSDLFDLFFQGRRPLRTVELSPEGRVYLNLFTAARGRSRQPGVPRTLLLTPEPAWTASLMALASSPNLNPSDQLAVLEGEWSGAIEGAKGSVPRRVEVSLTPTPAGLSGQTISRQVPGANGVSLTGLSFVRGELRFTFSETGEELTFRGVLDGDTIEGVVTRASGETVGKSTLKLTIRSL